MNNRALKKYLLVAIEKTTSFSKVPYIIQAQ